MAAEITQSMVEVLFQGPSNVSVATVTQSMIEVLVSIGAGYPLYGNVTNVKYVRLAQGFMNDEKEK